MKIQVNKNHIDLGKCKVPQQCMIAAAIREFAPDISYVSVRTNCITITRRKKDGSIRQHWMVPMKAARAIIAFDEGKPVAPFSFNTKLIEEARIPPVSAAVRRRDAKRTKERREKLKAAGEPPPKYGRRSRIAGV